MNSKRSLKTIAVTAATVVVHGFALAVVATSFDGATLDAPLILRVRCVESTPGSNYLAVTEVIKGAEPNSPFVSNHADWFFRPLKPNHDYVVLLADDLRPYVGPLTRDADPALQVPAFMCGTINVLEVINGGLYGETGFIKRGDGSRLPYQDFRARFAAEPDAMARHVASLIDETTNAQTEDTAFKSLEALGPQGVPFIVAHLSDSRALPVKAISLVNKSVNAFEGLRHYGPETVHDALSAILNQITGQGFEFVYNGASSEVRERDSKAWKAWCVKSYPQMASACEHGM